MNGAPSVERMYVRWLAVVVLALVLVVSTGVRPAGAVVGDEGYKNCGPKWVMLKSDSWGATYHFRDVTLVAYWMVPQWDFRYSNTGATSTPWQILVYGGGLDGSDTYPYCSSAGPG